MSHHFPSSSQTGDFLPFPCKTNSSKSSFSSSSSLSSSSSSSSNEKLKSSQSRMSSSVSSKFRDVLSSPFWTHGVLSRWLVDFSGSSISGVTQVDVTQVGLTQIGVTQALLDGVNLWAGSSKTSFWGDFSKHSSWDDFSKLFEAFSESCFSAAAATISSQADCFEVASVTIGVGEL